MAPGRRQSVAPQGYFGLEAVADRMGVSRTTILAWHRRYLFPLYIRRVGPRRVWYTHEGLIERWEFERCRDEHRHRYGPSTEANPPPPREHRSARLAEALAPFDPIGATTQNGNGNGHVHVEPVVTIPCECPPSAGPIDADGLPGIHLTPRSRGPTDEVLDALNALSLLVSRFAHVTEPSASER